MVVLPPKVCLVLAALGACLTLLGSSFQMPLLTKIGNVFLTAAMVGFWVYMIVLLLALPDHRPVPDTRLITYLRAFFSDWATGMSGPLSVPFVALAVWSNQRGQKIIWCCLAIVSALYGSYRVWRKERLASYARVIAKGQTEHSKQP